MTRKKHWHTENSINTPSAYDSPGTSIKYKLQESHWRKEPLGQTSIDLLHPQADLQFSKTTLSKVPENSQDTDTCKEAKIQVPSQIQQPPSIPSSHIIHSKPCMATGHDRHLLPLSPNLWTITIISQISFCESQRGTPAKRTKLRSFWITPIIAE